MSQILLKRQKTIIKGYDKSSYSPDGAANVVYCGSFNVTARLNAFSVRMSVTL